MIDNKYKLVSRKKHSENTIIHIGDMEIGAGGFTIIAGPCAVENEKQISEIANYVKRCGADVLRGGVFKPRTSPYDFQGMGVEGVKLLDNVQQEVDIPAVTEIMDASQIPSLENITMLQIGSRNMQNYSLLKAVGKIRKPIILKRGYGCTIDELLFSAEYILMNGNPNVILCERGVRTFQQCTRNMLDISCIPILKKITHLPIIIDPSHAAGRSDLVPLLCEIAMVAGADGILVEVHNNPEKALCDGAQALNLNEFSKLIDNLDRRYKFEMEQRRL